MPEERKKRKKQPVVVVPSPSHPPACLTPRAWGKKPSWGCSNPSATYCPLIQCKDTLGLANTAWKVTINVNYWTFRRLNFLYKVLHRAGAGCGACGRDCSHTGMGFQQSSAPTQERNHQTITQLRARNVSAGSPPPLEVKTGLEVFLKGATRMMERDFGEGPGEPGPKGNGFKVTGSGFRWDVGLDGIYLDGIY